MKAHYALGLLLCLASCKAVEPSATQESEAPSLSDKLLKDDKLSDKSDPGAGYFDKQVANSKPGPLSSIGKIFSTPEGTARRQARKDAAATVPKKLGKGAVYAPAAKEVLYVWKADGSVALASDSATATVTDNTKAGQRGGAAATAPGATATTTTKNGLPWWPFALAAVLVGAYVYRKRILPSVFA